MKLINNNIQNSFINLSLTILIICFAIDTCGAHKSKDISPKVETKSTNAHSPKASHLEEPPCPPPSEAPKTQNPSSHSSSEAPKTQNPSSGSSSEAPKTQNPSLDSSSEASFSHSSSFSAAFSDILNGNLDDHNSKTKHTKNSALEKICSHTLYPQICLSTIPQLLNHKTKIDLVSVLEASIKACTLQVKVTMTKVEQHVAKSPELAAAVGDCKEKYHSALKNLLSAIHAIHSHDFGKVTVILSSVMADVSTCESKFEDLKSPHVKSKTHGLVSITVNNCLSITKMIQH